MGRAGFVIWKQGQPISCCKVRAQAMMQDPTRGTHALRDESTRCRSWQQMLGDRNAISRSARDFTDPSILPIVPINRISAAHAVSVSDRPAVGAGGIRESVEAVRQRPRQRNYNYGVVSSAAESWLRRSRQRRTIGKAQCAAAWDRHGESYCHIADGLSPVAGKPEIPSASPAANHSEDARDALMHIQHPLGLRIPSIRI